MEFRSFFRKMRQIMKGRKPRQASRSLYLEALEARILLSVSWDGEAGTANWRDAVNWSTNALPGSTDDVVIGSAFNGVTINYDTITSTIKSLTMSDPAKSRRFG